MNFNDILSKLIPGSWKKAADIKYDFDMDEDRYTLNMTVNMPRNWWIQLITKFNAMMIGKKIELLDEFETDNSKLLDMMKNRLRKPVDKIVKDLRNDKPMKNLKLLDMNIEKVRFKKIDDYTVRCEIFMKGLCIA